MLSLSTDLQGILTHRVEPKDLATSWQNDVPVLATPVLLWLAELACMRAIDNTFSDQEMSLGYGHEFVHLAPTPENWTVHITARLVEIEGKILTFDVEARDDQDLILSGRHIRAIVNREEFVAKVEAKTRSTGQSDTETQNTTH